MNIEIFTEAMMARYNLSREEVIDLECDAGTPVLENAGIGVDGEDADYYYEKYISFYAEAKKELGGEDANQEEAEARADEAFAQWMAE